MNNKNISALCTEKTPLGEWGRVSMSLRGCGLGAPPHVPDL